MRRFLRKEFSEESGCFLHDVFNLTAQIASAAEYFSSLSLPDRPASDTDTDTEGLKGTGA
jgi:hypothetical protein